MRPMFSIIIPIYNVQSYLKDCIDSVLIQDFKDIEVVLVNDGSVDSSPLICDDYAQKDDRVIVIHKLNGGLSEARNAGLELARGNYILFLDGDDYWIDKNALNSLMPICLNEDADIVYFNCVEVYERKIVEQSPFDISRVNGLAKEKALGYLMKADLFIPSACFKAVKKSLLINKKILFQKGLLSEDIDWNFNLTIQANNIWVVNNHFYAYRQREGSITKTITKKNINDLLGIIEKWSRLIPKQVSNIEEQELLLGYCAYQLFTLMGDLCYISKKEKEEFWERIRSLTYLCKYVINGKVEKAAKLYSLIGLKPTVFVLGCYIKLHGLGFRVK